MADQPITKEKLINADIDVDNLGKAANGLGTVNPRYGNPYKTAPQVIQDLQQKADQVVAQGFYKGYTTEALLLADKPAVAEMRARADDTRKIYRWTRTSAEGVTPTTGNWVDTGLSDREVAFDYTNSKLDPLLEGKINLGTGDYLAISPSRNAQGVFFNFVAQADARTAVIAIEPNTDYTLRKNEKTQNYIVIEHSQFPVARMDDVFIRTIHDSSSTGVFGGELKFKTSNNAKWISVTTSIVQSQAPQLVLTKNKIIGDGFVETKNKLNPFLKNAPVSISYIDQNTMPFSGATTPDIKSLITAVEKNTQYTLSLSQPTSRFKAILINVSSTGVRSYTNLLDQNGATKLTFTTGANTLYFALYYTNTSEDPDIQIEKSSVATTFEPYGFKLKYQSGQSVSGNIISIDPAGDIDQQLQSAFAQSANNVIYIMGGSFDFNGTLNIPSNARIIGLGEVALNLTSTNNLETVSWRNSNVKAYLKTDVDSKNAYLENIKVVGTDLDTTSLHFGICMQGSGHELKNVSTDHINWEVTDSGERRTGGNGWGLVFYRAKDCKVKGGRFTYGGYENVGTDNAEDITFENIYCGTGWRTSFQAHRNSKNITLINPTIKQTTTSQLQTHAALTIHGIETEQVQKVKVIGGEIDAVVGLNAPPGRGAVQSVDGFEQGVSLQGVTIKSNRNGIVSSTEIQNVINNWIITGCDINAAQHSVLLRGRKCIVSNNIIEANEDVKFEGLAAETCMATGNIFTQTT